MFGYLTSHLLDLNRELFEEVYETIYPADSDLWIISFGTFLKTNRAWDTSFLVLQKDYEKLLECDLELEDESKVKILNHLGDHLIAHYMWGEIEFNADSILDNFFEVCSNESHSHVIFNVGRSLRKSKNLPAEMIKRAEDLWDWREQTEDVLELKAFESWLKCECFSCDWRLTKLKKVLSHVSMVDMRAFSIIDFLSESVNKNLTLTLECLELLTDTKEYVYFDNEKIAEILSLGDSSKTIEDRKVSIRARDNLLKAGHYNFKD